MEGVELRRERRAQEKSGTIELGKRVELGRGWN